MTAATVIGTFFIGKDIFHNIENAKIVTILVMDCSPAIFAFAIQLPNYRIKTQYNVPPTNYLFIRCFSNCLGIKFFDGLYTGFKIIFLTATKEHKFDTSPLLSWQMTVVALGVVMFPLLMLLRYDAFRKLIKR